MKLLEKFNQTLGFTPSESKVILILVGAFLLGWGIKYYKQVNPRQPAFDYTAADSEFNARSTRAVAPGDWAFAGDSSRRYANDMVNGKNSARSAAKVNINLATKDELIGLPGIGEAMAERIILYREDHGPFATVEELEGVKGIGKKKLEHLVPLCTTGK